jgi:hypothetical protein
MIPPS